MNTPDTRTLYHSEAGYKAMMDWYETEFARLSCDVSLETRFVETRYGLTHVVASGDESAPPLVMIQGLGGNAMMLYPQFRTFAPHFRLIVPDVPGQPGKSAPTRIPHVGDHFARWLSDVLDELKCAKVNILGISQGARIVIKFGSYVSERIHRSVLISPMGLSALNLGLARQAIGIALGSVKSRGDVFQKMLDALLVGEVDHSDTDMRHLTQAFYLFFKHFKQELITGVPTVLTLPKSELSYYDPHTILLVGGEERLFDPKKAIRRAKKHFSHLDRSVLLPKAGHIMHYEQSEVVNQHILDYLLKE